MSMSIGSSWQRRGRLSVEGSVEGSVAPKSVLSPVEPKLLFREEFSITLLDYQTRRVQSCLSFAWEV